MADKKMGPKEAAQRAMREKRAVEDKRKPDNISRIKAKGVGKVVSLKGSTRGR